MIKKDIILTPFGADAVLLEQRLNSDGIKIKGFFDRNPLLQYRKWNEAYIQRPYYRNDTVVIICARNYYDEIKSMLLERGYDEENILSIDDVKTYSNSYEASLNIDFDKFRTFMPDLANNNMLKLKKYRQMAKLGIRDESAYERFSSRLRDEIWIDEQANKHIILKRFEFDITRKCSLNCESCGALIQYTDNPVDVSLEQALKDYDRMLELIDWTDDVLIMGGEPLLYDKLPLILDHMKENPETVSKVGVIKVITNGTIVPDDKLIKSIKDCGAQLVISNYRELSRKMVQIVEKCLDNHVQYEILDLKFWTKTQQLMQIEQPLSEAELIQKRRKCSKRHHVVSEGKFYLCAFLTGADKIRAIPYNKENFVDIFETDAKEEIIQHIAQNRALPEGCSWCSGNYLNQWDEEGWIPVAIQSKEKMKYKKYS